MSNLRSAYFAPGILPYRDLWNVGDGRLQRVDSVDASHSTNRGARKTDPHWTELGHEVVAERLAKEVVALAK